MIAIVPSKFAVICLSYHRKLLQFFPIIAHWNKNLGSLMYLSRPNEVTSICSFNPGYTCKILEFFLSYNHTSQIVQY